MTKDKIIATTAIERVTVDLTMPRMARYWTERLGVTEPLLRETIKKAGNKVIDVEGHIEEVIAYYTHTYALCS